MNPRIPSFASVLQHALIGVMATVYIIAAGVQINRGSYTTAFVDLVITALLGVLLEMRKPRYGRLFANYSMRRHVRRLGEERNCGWCGEAIEADAPAITHRGAHKGEGFLVHHHPECDDAVEAWYQESLNEKMAHVRYPAAGGRRGSGRSRDTD